MKKRHLFTALTLGLVTGGALQQEAKRDLQAEVGRLHRRVDEVEAYLAAQAEAEQALLGAVNRSVTEGFTAGINYEARQTLVEAWRARASAAGRGVPGKGKKTPGEGTEPRPRRRDR